MTSEINYQKTPRLMKSLEKLYDPLTSLDYVESIVTIKNETTGPRSICHHTQADGWTHKQ